MHDPRIKKTEIRIKNLTQIRKNFIKLRGLIEEVALKKKEIKRNQTQIDVSKLGRLQRKCCRSESSHEDSTNEASRVESTTKFPRTMP